MKTFFYRIACTLLFSALLLEIILRVFQLAGNTLPEVDLNGNRMLKPGKEGTWIKGGAGEIRSHYSINAQGWNSTVDFDRIDTAATSIAIIGDSYVQGLHEDVENSIGRLLETKSSRYQVHEYGRDGANIADFLLVYDTWVRGNYDYVFVLVSPRNLDESEPSFMHNGSSIASASLIRKVYNASYLIRYLNINHGLLTKLNALFREGPESLQGCDDPGDGTEAEGGQEKRKEIITSFDPSVVFICQPGIDTSLVEGHSQFTIRHDIQPISYGFDGHWNLNGRINCANSIHRYITTTLQ